MKFFTILTAALISALSVSAQEAVTYLGNEGDAIRLDCITGEHQLHQAGTAGSWVSVSGDTRILKLGAPDLPKYSEAIIVDDEARMEVVITHESFEEFYDVDIVPSKGNLLRTVDPSTVPYTYGPSYSTDAFWPGKLAELGEPFVQGHFRGQAIHFYPVQYNPVTRVMRVYHHIEVEVVPTDEAGANVLTQTPGTSNVVFQEMYRSHFINYPTNADRYEVMNELGNMLVITHAQYIEELQPWVQWKKEKGIPVEVVDVATIGNLTAVLNYIEDYYLENGLTYLVVVGDEDQVPVQLVNNASGQGYCDACYGYISGNDHYSEIFVGRLLVHNDDELVPVIDKILEYEKNPYMATDWFSTAMGIGSNEGAGFGDDGEADWQHNNGIKEDLLDFTYNSVYERYDGNHTAASPTGGVTADGSGNPSASSISEVINSGCSLINYTGHGNHDIIVTGSFTNTNINALNNHGKYPYWIIVGCCVGDYDDDSGSGDTFGEAWLKTDNPNQPTGGIGGAFSSVFQSWAPPMEGQDEMNQIIADMVNYDTRHTLGSIHFHGCAAMNDAYDGGGHDMTDTWTLMGDPSVQLRTAFPTQITASHPASAFFGVTQLTVSSASNNALVSLTMDGEIIATGLIANGVCNLTFDPVTGPGSILVTLTNFNTIPYQGYVELVPAEGPYVVNTSNVVDDVLGNDNGLADYTEVVRLDVTLENIGIEMAYDVVATLSTTDSYVTITDDTHDAGNINLGDVVELQNAFVFAVAADVPDQHVVLFTVTLTDAENNTWTSTFTVTLNAPVLTCQSDYTIDDSSGDGDGRLDSGETVTITVPVLNEGHAATVADVVGTLSENTMYTTLVNTTSNAGSAGIDEIVYMTFTLEIADDAPAGEPVSLGFSASSGAYSTDCTFDENINLVMEDWESGDADQFEWIMEGDANWFVTQNNPYEGDYCMQSGNIGDNDQTILKIVLTLDEPGEVSFAYKVSSESGWDYLNFRVNGVTVQSWSGEEGWSEFSYNLNAGTQTLRWIYEKDEIYSDGDDAAWVDNIILPPSISVSVSEEKMLTEALDVYPNPAHDQAVVNFRLEQPGSAVIIVEDAQGRKVAEINKGQLGTGEYRVDLNTAAWASGLYFVRLVTDHGTETARLIRN